MVGSEQEPRPRSEAPTAAAGVAAAVLLETAEAGQALAVLFTAAAGVTAAIPATAALVLSAKASSTNRFCVRMQSSVPSWTSRCYRLWYCRRAKLPDLGAS